MTTDIPVSDGSHAEAEEHRKHRTTADANTAAARTPPAMLRSLAFLVSPPDGTGTVVVPHAFGGVSLFARSLIGRLPRSAALLTLQAHGLSGGAPDTSLPAMAARYVDELDAAGPPRPTVALGFCMGYGIALAMASRAPERFAALVLIDPGPDEPSGDDNVAAFAFDQIPEQHRPPWPMFRAADRATRLAWLAEVFRRKGVGEDAAARIVHGMYRVWEANAGCAPLRDPDVVPEGTRVVVVTEDEAGLRDRLRWTRPVRVEPMRPRRGPRFTDLDLDTVSRVVGDLVT
ncbi:alpha/beta fold hydrolase [Streptomyces sp. NPDC017940]|uniref:alpha/beta fold hydrolase n=1 Tax=Streptomyces sp. NPDC017940 TaxID=3365017 RepID=UPI003791B1FD